MRSLPIRNAKLWDLNEVKNGCSLCKWIHDDCVYIYIYIHILNLSTKLKQTCVKVEICYPQDPMLGASMCASSKWAAIDSTPSLYNPFLRLKNNLMFQDFGQNGVLKTISASLVGLLCQSLGHFLLDKLHMRSWYLTKSTDSPRSLVHVIHFLVNPATFRSETHQF